jgi:hypothetical protein
LAKSFKQNVWVLGLTALSWNCFRKQMKRICCDHALVRTYVAPRPRCRWLGGPRPLVRLVPPLHTRWQQWQAWLSAWMGGRWNNNTKWVSESWRHTCL